MKLNRLREIQSKLEAMQGAHRDPRQRHDYELYQCFIKFLTAEPQKSAPGSEDIAHDCFVKFCQDQLKGGFYGTLAFINKPRLIHRVMESWRHECNQQTFLELNDILDIPNKYYLVLDQYIFDVRELKQNMEQTFYYRHPYTRAFFTRNDIRKLRHAGLEAYAKKLEALYDEQDKIPEGIISALHTMLSEYFVYGQTADGKFSFDEPALRQCEIAKATFMACVMAQSPLDQARFFNSMVKCCYQSGGWSDIVVSDLLRPDSTNYQGCIIVEQIRLWILLTSRYPDRFCFPRVLMKRCEFRLGGYQLPPNIQLGESPSETPTTVIEKEMLPAKRPKKNSEPRRSQRVADRLQGGEGLSGSHSLSARHAGLFSSLEHPLLPPESESQNVDVPSSSS